MDDGYSNFALTFDFNITPTFNNKYSAEYLALN